MNRVAAKVHVGALAQHSRNSRRAQRDRTLFVIVTISRAVATDQKVAALDKRTITPPPDIGTLWRSDYISGVGRRDDGFVIIFDLPRLLSSDDVALLRAAEPPRMAADSLLHNIQA